MVDAGKWSLDIPACRKLYEVLVQAYPRSDAYLLARQVSTGFGLIFDVASRRGQLLWIDLLDSVTQAGREVDLMKMVLADPGRVVCHEAVREWMSWRESQASGPARHLHAVPDLPGSRNDRVDALRALIAELRESFTALGATPTAGMIALQALDLSSSLHQIGSLLRDWEQQLAAEPPAYEAHIEYLALIAGVKDAARSATVALSELASGGPASGRLRNSIEAMAGHLREPGATQTPS